MRRGLYTTTALTLSLAVAANGQLPFAGPARADPAVSRPNGKLIPFGGVVSDDGTGGVAGAISLPLGHDFGVQVDGLVGTLDGDLATGGAIHIFWRDPDIALVGVYASHLQVDSFGGLEVNRIAFETEIYRGEFTFNGLVGYRETDLVDDDVYGRASIEYYLTDDALVSAGYAYDDDSFLTLEAEAQIASTSFVGTSVFAEAQVNDDDNYSVVGGLTFYFSDPKSLRDRHRRDDPPVYLTEDFTPIQKAKQSTGPQCPVPIDFGRGHGTFCFGKPTPSPQLFNACRCGDFAPT